MKIIQRFLLAVLSLVILLFIIDLYFFRSYFSCEVINLYNQKYYTYSENEEDKYEIENNSFDLKIKSEKDFYTITLKNKTIKPFLTMSPWRGDQIIYNINDSLFNNFYRLKVSTPKYKSEYDYSLGCLGSGPFSINPYESFSYKIPHDKFLKQYNLNFRYFFKEKNDTIVDILYDKPLLYKNKKLKEFKIFNRDDIKSKKIINVQLYLNVYTYNFKHHMVVESPLLVYLMKTL